MSQAQIDEFTVRVPKSITSEQKRVSILKFNNNLSLDVSQWTSDTVALSREDNKATYAAPETLPSSGVGSEFGRQLRDEARRKKLGYSSSKYNKDDQPWLLTLNEGASQPKRYRGIKEGGIAQNADYWVFVRAGDGVFDAYPVDDWYNFMPVARYKTLDADEAEEQFSKRNRILNQFALKIQQKLEANEEPAAGSSGGQIRKRDEDDEDTKKPKNKSDDESDDKKVRPTKGKLKKGKNGKKAKPKKSKRKNGGDDDDDLIASAESDDGDEEGREVDYMSDSEMSSSSEEEPEKVRKALVGVDEEEGMKKLIESDQEEENENAEDEEEEENGGKMKFDKAIKRQTITTVGADDNGKGSDSGSDSDDPDEEDVKSPLFLKDVKSSQMDTTSQASSSSEGQQTPPSTAGKRPASDDGSTPAKKVKLEKDSGAQGISEEEVRRYLQRKPQSSKDLVAKFKPKCQNMSKSDVVKCLAAILKKLAPDQTERNGTMYFSLKK